MNRTMGRAAIITAAALGLAEGGAAQTTRPQGPPVAVSRPSVEVAVTSGIWAPRLGGKARLGPSASAERIDLADQFGLDDTEATFNFELTVRKQEIWDLVLGGFHFSTDSTVSFRGSSDFGPLSLDDGDTVRTSFEISSFSVELHVGMWRPYAGDDGAPPNPRHLTRDGRFIADLRFTPQFGMRYLDIDQTVEEVGVGVVQTGGEWVAVYAGMGFELQYRPENRLPWLDMLEGEASFALGPALGGDGGFMWQVRGGLTLHFTDHFGLMVGYRLVELDLEVDDYELTGGLQGLFFAGEIRF